MLYIIDEIETQPFDKPVQKYPRLYFHEKNEGVYGQLVNRRYRPHTEYRKLLPQVFERLGITEEIQGNAKWSQYAGCSCPCSPGFILKVKYDQDIWVTVVMDEEEALKLMTVPSEEQNVSNHAIRESTEEAGEQDAIARYLNPEQLKKTWVIYP
jgi:hypothetical protein